MTNRLAAGFAFALCAAALAGAAHAQTQTETETTEPRAPQTVRPDDPNAAAPSVIIQPTPTARSARSTRYLSVPRPEADEGGAAWSFIVGGGAIVRPSYVGADSYEITPVPAISITYKDIFFADPTRGIGFSFIRDRRLRVSAGANYGFGRDEDDNSRFMGLGDLDGGVIAFAEAEARPFTATILQALSLQLAVETPVTGDVSGLSATADVAISFPLGEHGFGTVSGGVIWADEDRMQDLFGITPAQSAATGLPVFEPASGIRAVSFGGTTMIPLGGRWSGLVGVGYDRLVNDGGRSPIVSERDQYRGAIALLYRLGG